jgi:hypothetical protein
MHRFRNGVMLESRVKLEFAKKILYGRGKVRKTKFDIPK